MTRTFTAIVLMLCLMCGALLAQNNINNPRTGEGFGSIQSAVDAAAEGDTVVIGPGRYAESVRIGKSLTLRSTSQQNNPDNDLPMIAPPNGVPAIAIGNPQEDPNMSVTIQGFHMEVSNSHGVTLEVANVTLQNNHIIGNGNSVAVFTYLPRQIILQWNVFQDFHTGLEGENMPNALIKQNRFVRVAEPVYLVTSPGTIVDGNVMWSIPEQSVARGATGVSLSRSPRSQVLNNVMCNYHTGTFVSSSDDAVIKSNFIQDDVDTDGNGILLAYTSRGRVEGNKITIYDYSMDMDNVQETVVIGNWMQDAELGLVNTMPDNPAFLVDARENWWGSPDGPSNEGPGRGVSVNRNVLFGNWLQAPPEKGKADTMKQECPVESQNRPKGGSKNH